MTEAERADIENVIGYRFRRPELLGRALTHRSFRACDASCEHNEHLEFLGDAVLGLLIADYLVGRFPLWPEGSLSRARARLVKAPALSEASGRLGLGRFLQLGPGEEKTGGRGKRNLLADAYEALVGGIFLDGGLHAAADFVQRTLIQPAFDERAEPFAGSDYKSALQEWLQARGRELAAYRVVQESGPQHAKKFLVEVEAIGRVLGRSEGASKKEAEQAAAAQALERLHREAETETLIRG